MRRLALLLLLLLPVEAWAALAATIQWDVRTGGAATNGGGWKTGASGTDWTQQDAAQYSVTDAVTAGTTTITSATANFGTDVVGNTLYITGGTGAIVADWYEITARGSNLSITVDRSTGLTTGTGATLKIGGAFASYATATSEVVAGNTVHIKGGTYTATLTTAVAGAYGTPITWTGYATTHGDAPTGTNRPFINASGLTNGILCAHAGNLFSHLRTATASADGVNVNATTTRFLNVKSSGNIDDGFGTAGSGLIFCVGCEGSGNTDKGFEATASTSTLICAGCTSDANGSNGFIADTLRAAYSIASDNAATGFTTDVSVIVNCTSEGNTGASSDGFATITSNALAVNNIASNNGRNGFDGDANTAPVFYRNNCYTNATACQNTDLEAMEAPLTLDPGYVDVGTDNYSIGTNMKNAGFPGVLLGGTGYTDLGALQAQCVGAGGSGGAQVVGGTVIK